MIHGVTFLFLRNGLVLLEGCPKKRAALGVGEWFVPGGKIEAGETAEEACVRELREELGMTYVVLRALPIVEGSPVGLALPGLFLMRPFHVVDAHGVIPTYTLDGKIELRWVGFREALHSPVAQVRMMVAAAML